MANKFELPTDTGLARKVIDSQSRHTQLKIKAGWLGAFFGDSTNVGLYIVGLISLILLLTATVYTFIPDTYKSTSLSAEKLWNIVLPVITTLIGYIFGFNNNSSTDKNVE
jgi:hypothetical protein